ncbi:MAG: hypothetical protein LQ339_003275 [Xanthoria mediterranea]|nr:MAG: hypothetical protein LQ339_003275 [Xanthoria mediterranea]
MLLQSLPNETLLQILHSISSVQDVLSLTLTSHRFHNLLSRPAQRLPILFDAAERQFGPLSSAVAVVTHYPSQFPHIPRPSPPKSLSLLKQILQVGQVANAWADLYPFTYWRGTEQDCASRRLLREHERYRVRRACYRIWLYDLAFHNANFRRYTRLQPPVVRSRAALLRAWPTRELGELLDFQSMMRAVLELFVCPSDGAVIHRHKERYGEMPLVNLSHPPGLKAHRYDHSSSTYTHPAYHHHEIWEGWGGDVEWYYVVEDMLKLHPGQLMELYDFVVNGKGKLGMMDGMMTTTTTTTSHKAAVKAFVARLGEWFDNNGETLGETVTFVISERGEGGEEEEEDVRGWGDLVL